MSQFPTVRLVLVFGAILVLVGCGNSGLGISRNESQLGVPEVGESQPETVGEVSEATTSVEINIVDEKPPGTPAPPRTPTVEPKITSTLIPLSTDSIRLEEQSNPTPRTREEEEAEPEPPADTGVLVETDKRNYRPDEEIVVIITNNLDTSLTTFDQQAFCSIILLERQETSEEWKKVSNCVSGLPNREVTLKPQTESIVKIPNPSPGTYRASIIFSRGENFKFGKSLVATSSTFAVE